MPSFCCTSRSSSLSCSGCLQCSSGTGAVGSGQTFSGGAWFTFWQLVSSCFKLGSVATAASPCSNQVCESRLAKLAMSAASSSTGLSGCFTTKAPYGFLRWSIRSLVPLSLGRGGAFDPPHAQQRAATPNPSLKPSANGRPPGPVWRYAVHFRHRAWRPAVVARLALTTRASRPVKWQGA